MPTSQRRLFRHPRIYPAAGAAPVTGILTEGPVIVAVGDAQELASSGVSIVELPGEAVLPGLHDAHIHTGALATSAAEVNLRSAMSLSHALQLISDHAAGQGDGWVLGGQWNSNMWSPPGQPDRHSLDSVTGDRPAVLWSVDKHTAWANSAALRRAGIDHHTPDPAGGRIVRDDDGEPTGILQENAGSIPAAVIAAENPADLYRDISAIQQQLLAVGLTAITDIDHDDVLVAFTRLHTEGRLALRVHKAVRPPDLPTALAQGRRTNDGDHWLGTGPLKIFADGALGSHTCHMTADFVGDPGNTGIAVTDVEQIADWTTTAVAAGLSVATHAIGDRAAQLVLDAYERCQPPSGVQLRIEHAQYLRRPDIERMAALDVIASMQPTHLVTDFELVDQILAGHDILSYPWRSLLDAGVRLAFGSDAPVEDPNPFHGLAAAISRQRPDGMPPGGWQPQQRISPVEALTAYTCGSAAAAGWSDRTGHLGPGLLADVVAVDTDPLRAPAEAIAATRVLTTVVGGEIAYQAS